MLRKVEKAAAKVVAAQTHMALVIREAHDEGEPLRKIAQAAGVSHEQVRRILSR